METKLTTKTNKLFHNMIASMQSATTSAQGMAAMTLQQLKEVPGKLLPSSKLVDLGSWQQRVRALQVQSVVAPVVAQLRVRGNQLKQVGHQLQRGFEERGGVAGVYHKASEAYSVSLQQVKRIQRAVIVGVQHFQSQAAPQKMGVSSAV
jgi:hypothetical protein